MVSYSRVSGIRPTRYERVAGALGWRAASTRAALWRIVPSIDEYFDASNRERVRALHTLAERLEKYGYDGDYLFVEANRWMLAEDTREWRERDRELVEAWYKASSSPADFVTLAGTLRGWSSCKLGVVTKGTSRQGE